MLGLPQVVQWVKNLLPATQETQMLSPDPGSGRIPGEGHDSQFSILAWGESHGQKRAWRPLVHRAAESWYDYRATEHIRTVCLMFIDKTSHLGISFKIIGTGVILGFGQSFFKPGDRVFTGFTVLLYFICM